MSDDHSPEAPGDADDSGVQRALGERRRRRLAERAGQVDLDATMSDWPATEPPTAPRPVVRPARPTLDGVATAPVLPPPGQLVIAPLVEARRVGTTGSSAPPAGGRRSRRVAQAAPLDPGAGSILPGGPGAVPQRSSEAAATEAPVHSRRAELPSTPSPAPLRPGGRGRDDEGAPGSAGLHGWFGTRLSWPPGPREAVLAAVALVIVLLVVVLLTQLLGGADAAGDFAAPTGGDPAGSTEPTRGDLP